MSYDPAAQPRQFWECPSLRLEAGGGITNFRQGFVVHGKPAPDGSNVVLVTSSLGGDAHRLDFLIGDGLALDPARYCIIATDAIGNGQSSSPSNSTVQPGMSFPQYGLRDMVEAQRRMLADVFGITKFLAVAGASMGGMQALQWAVAHPGAMKAIVALVPLARTPAWSVIANEVSRRILILDPAWKGGAYTEQPKAGWQAASAFLQTMTTLTPEYIDELCPTGHDPIEWLDKLVAGFIARGFDANDWICQTRAYDAHDIGDTAGFGGDTEAALRSISVPALVMGPPLDLLNPALDQQELAKHTPQGRFVPIPSNRGHMAANVGDAGDVALINTEVAAFLNAIPQ